MCQMSYFDTILQYFYKNLMAYMRILGVKSFQPDEHPQHCPLNNARVIDAVRCETIVSGNYCLHMTRSLLKQNNAPDFTL